MEHALYDTEDGFFARGGGAGRATGDFLTSPEVGPLFGALVARALDGWWRALGAPDPFVVVDAGAGTGRLAADVLRAQPACLRALRYVLVERSRALRSAQRDRLDLEPPDRALGPATRAHADEAPEPVAGIGPVVTSLDDLPALGFEGVVLANELLDNLPFAIAERTAGGWSEVRVGEHDGSLVEVVVPAPPAVMREADRVAGGADVPAGARLPVPTGTAAWLSRCGEHLRRGHVLVVDYADSAAGLIGRGQTAWLRTYRGHERGGSPLADPGTQDLTCDVAVEHLVDAARRARLTLVEHTTQREWLRALGVEGLATAGAAAWRERAHVGDLEAVAARSLVTEAEALTDPSGFGAHHVFVFERAAT